MRVLGTVAVLGAVTLFSWPWLRRIVPDLPALGVDRFQLVGICLLLGVALYFIGSRTE